MQNPLLTFLVLGHNQERFITAAVESAFAQTYTPLQIILSDDASDDHTFPIMEHMARSYKGRHKVELNRNSISEGIGAHLDRLMGMTRGRLIVVNAGDDISLPERTEVLFRAWERTDRRATSIYSDYTLINEDGFTLNSGTRNPAFACESETVDLQHFIRFLAPRVNGCTHAWTPDLFSFFGPLTKQVTVEDIVLSFRSHAIGAILHVNQNLLFYRRHTHNNSSHWTDGRPKDAPSLKAVEDKERTHLNNHIRCFQQMFNDLNTLFAKDLINHETFSRVSAEITRGITDFQLHLAMKDAAIYQRLVIVLRACQNRSDLKGTLKLVSRCLPRRFHDFLRIMRNRLID